MKTLSTDSRPWYVLKILVNLSRDFLYTNIHASYMYMDNFGSWKEMPRLNNFKSINPLFAHTV